MRVMLNPGETRLRAACAVVLCTGLLLGWWACPAEAQGLPSRFVLAPDRYLAARGSISAVPFSSQALEMALAQGLPAAFEIAGEVQMVQPVGQGTQVAALLALRDGLTITLRLPEPAEVLVPGNLIRVLGVVTTSGEQTATLRVVGMVSELTLAQYEQAMAYAPLPVPPSSQMAEAGTPPAALGVAPSLLPDSTQAQQIPTARYIGSFVQRPEQELVPSLDLSTGSARLAAYGDLIAHYNPDLEAGLRNQIAWALLYWSDYYGVAPALITAVIRQESNFNPRAVSHAGAMGLGQLMPVHVEGFGMRNVYDPVENLKITVRILRGHLEGYRGWPTDQQLALALACYNAGPGAVRKYGGIPPYRETQNYVRSVSSLFRDLYARGYR